MSRPRRTETIELHGPGAHSARNSGSAVFEPHPEMGVGVSDRRSDSHLRIYAARRVDRDSRSAAAGDQPAEPADIAPRERTLALDVDGHHHPAHNGTVFVFR